MGQTLQLIPQELVKALKSDRMVCENVRVRTRVTIKCILCKYDFPADKCARAAQTVLEQAEALSRAWTEGGVGQ